MLGRHKGDDPDLVRHPLPGRLPGHAAACHLQTPSKAAAGPVWPLFLPGRPAPDFLHEQNGGSLMSTRTEQGTDAPVRVLRLPQVLARTGLSRSSIYLRVADGTFPQPVRLGKRAIGWIESEIDQWIRAQIATSRGSA